MEAIYEEISHIESDYANEPVEHQELSDYGRQCYDAFCDRVERGDPSTDPYIQAGPEDDA